MPAITLKKFFEKDGRLILGGLLKTLGDSVVILEADGKPLYGIQSETEPRDSGRSPILQDGKLAGWVVGDQPGRSRLGVAALLSFLLEQESQKRALAAEVLDKYRELNLLYRLSEKLLTSPQPEAIARMALDEICPMIQVEVGMVALKGEDEEDLEVIANCGHDYRLKNGSLNSGGIIERVLRTGVAELSNEMAAQECFEDMPGVSISLLCAPLKTEKRILGVIIMVGDQVRQFTAGDLKLLNTIAMQTAPAIDIAHLHQMALEKARMERELQMAHQVQADLLPRKMPRLDGWRLAAYWQPAREVSGDFFDFIRLSNGKLILIIADVTDKGMPAALVMANTRSVLRAVSASANRKERESPGKLMALANNLLCKDMPMHMFVTCLLMIFDPKTGRICFSNAGHPLPIQRTSLSVLELCATGFPLGIFPRVTYEEREATLGYGDSLLMYSDGLIEAHDPQGDMFGTPRLHQFLERRAGSNNLQGDDLIKFLMARLADFTRPGWEQEDDVTFVTLAREAAE
jgi:serine phosphatase RsbU (regulator of sigma subunit)